MLNLNYLILYVDNPQISASFYSQLLGLPPVESLPTFVLYALPSGFKFGLWSKHTVDPEIEQLGTGSEIGFPVENSEKVLDIYQLWQEQKVPIVQHPVQMDFGFTFVGLDADGHRLRVFALNPR